jgi:hypothetical protein
MKDEEFISHMEEFLDEFDNLVAEYVEDCGWNANEVFQAYLNIGWDIAEKMVGCSKIPISEVRKRVINLVTTSLNSCFDTLENPIGNQQLN